MTLRRKLVPAGAAIWLVLAAVWYLDAPVFGRSAAPWWFVYLLALLPLLLAFELLIGLREQVAKRRKETGRDA